MGFTFSGSVFGRPSAVMERKVLECSTAVPQPACGIGALKYGTCTGHRLLRNGARPRLASQDSARSLAHGFCASGVQEQLSLGRCSSRSLPGLHWRDGRDCRPIWRPLGVGGAITWLLAGGLHSPPCGPLPGMTCVLTAGQPPPPHERVTREEAALSFMPWPQRSHTITSVALCGHTDLS